MRTSSKHLFRTTATAAVMAGLLAAGPAASAVAPLSVALAQTSYDTTNAQVIDVSETADVTIKAPGTYVITGTAAEGSVKVKKGTTGVTLVLRDLTLSNSTTAPLTINKDNGDVVVAIEGTVRLTDTENVALDDTDDESYEGAAIKVKAGSNLVLTGSGTLVADSSADKNGIKVADESTLTIESGTYRITAANDGIHAGNLLISGGSVTVAAGDDGIKAEYDVTIGTRGAASGPTVTVTRSYEALEGATVNIHSGTVNLTASDDGINAANSDLGSYAFELNVTGGTVVVDAQGDGLDSNGNITTSGGTVVVFGAGNNGNAAVDYGDRGNSWTNTGATVIAVGMSGMATTPSGVYALFGAAGMGGGGFGGQMGGMGGQMGDMGQNQGFGARGDGSFGGPQGQMGQEPGGMGQVGRMEDMGGRMGDMGGQMGGRGLMVRSTDADEAEAEVTALSTEAMGGFGGGAAGGFGGMGDMGQGAQPNVSISAGQTLTVTDASGNVLYSGTAPRQANSVVVTSPDMAEGDTYTLTVGSETYSATATSGASGGTFGSGAREGALGGEQGGFGGANGQGQQAPEQGQGGPQAGGAQNGQPQGGTAQRGAAGGASGGAGQGFGQGGLAGGGAATGGSASGKEVNGGQAQGAGQGGSGAGGAASGGGATAGGAAPDNGQTQQQAPVQPAEEAVQQGWPADKPTQDPVADGQGKAPELPEQGRPAQELAQPNEQPTGQDDRPTQHVEPGWKWSSRDGWTYQQEDGTNKNGWLWDDGVWYYLDPTRGGQMATGWRFVDNDWYLMNRSGAMQTGWQFDGGNWYYLNGSGAMLRNQRTPDGYWVGQDGAWK